MHYKNIDDYSDTRPSKLMEITKRFIPAIIFISGMTLMVLVYGAL